MVIFYLARVSSRNCLSRCRSELAISSWVSSFIFRVRLRGRFSTSCNLLRSRASSVSRFLISDRIQQSRFEVVPLADKAIYYFNHAERMKGISAPRRDPAKSDAYAKRGVIKNYGRDRPEVIVFRDSQALMWSFTLDEVFKNLKVSACLLTADEPTLIFSDQPNSSPTHFFNSEQKKAFDASRYAALKEFAPRLILVLPRWQRTASCSETSEQGNARHYFKSWRLI